ncbi:ATP-dependent DNA helicase [Trichonephila clavipes]|nr:ATP-dependent DNA helicase [Trichonephila clavipes]
MMSDAVRINLNECMKNYDYYAKVFFACAWKESCFRMVHERRFDWIIENPIVNHRYPTKSDAERAQEYRARNKAKIQERTSQSLNLVETKLIQQLENENNHLAYTDFHRDHLAHDEFQKKFVRNSFGHVCSVCQRLRFKDDLRSASLHHYTILKTIVPHLDIKDVSLYLVSERLVSPRIPFMQIRRLRHVNGQYGIFGQIINVPVSIDSMVRTLPRNLSDDLCINVHIKRKKIHNSSYLHGIINKGTIKIWLQFLLKSPLYTMYDIEIDESFFENNDIDTIPQDEISEHIPIEESLVSQQQTLMWNEAKYLRLAPGEKNLPHSLLFDEHAQELSFPAIYLGQFRTFRDGVRVTPYTMATSELRRSDRRAVTPYHVKGVFLEV